MNENDFSGIPALGDTAGLEQILQDQALAASGVQPVPQETPATNPNAGGVNPAVTPATDPNAGGVNPAQGASPAQGANLAQGGGLGNSLIPNNLTREDLAKIIAQIDAVRAATSGSQGQGQQPVRQQPVQQGGYTQAEKNFISSALAKGYDLNTINKYIVQRRAQANPITALANPNAAIEQRMAALENYLQSKEYAEAQEQFVGRLSEFGSKWGLSEQDLVLFGQTALQKGINIAMPGVDFETVFRAIYPEQYALRAQRMNPANASQIIGGSSVPEGNRRAASAAEDAYVEAFLRQHMPNQYVKK